MLLLLLLLIAITTAGNLAAACPSRPPAVCAPAVAATAHTSALLPSFMHLPASTD
jgi:hypothetical protein